MYYLTLTSDERRAFDWINSRYTTGDIADVLTDCMGPDDDWLSSEPITFNIPETVAWTIKDYADADDCLWPCFGLELTRKMISFVNSIV